MYTEKKHENQRGNPSTRRAMNDVLALFVYKSGQSTRWCKLERRAGFRPAD